MPRHSILDDDISPDDFIDVTAFEPDMRRIPWELLKINSHNERLVRNLRLSIQELTNTCQDLAKRVYAQDSLLLDTSAGVTPNQKKS